MDQAALEVTGSACATRDRNAPPVLGAPLLELRRMTKTYGSVQNPVSVLHAVDLTITAGEYVAIAGPSGSGKSTMLNILGCLDRPTSGSYCLAGEDVSRLDDQNLSRIRNLRIGF